MTKLKQILSNKSGLAAPLACAIVIALVLVMSGVVEFIRLQIIASGVRDALQTAVTSVATQNYDKVYGGLREGYAGGYEISTYDTWSESIDMGNVYGYLDDTLGLHRTEANHIKMAGGKLEYKLYGMEVNVVNVPFAPDNPANTNKFTADVKITLEVPVYFGGVELLPMKISLRVRAGYTPKFY